MSCCCVHISASYRKWVHMYWLNGKFMLVLFALVIVFLIFLHICTLFLVKYMCCHYFWWLEYWYWWNLILLEMFVFLIVFTHCSFFCFRIFVVVLVYRSHIGYRFTLFLFIYWSGVINFQTSFLIITTIRCFFLLVYLGIVGFLLVWEISYLF